MIETDGHMLIEHAAAGKAGLYLVGLSERRSDALKWVAAEAEARGYIVRAGADGSSLTIGGFGGRVVVRDMTDKRGRSGFDFVRRAPSGAAAKARAAA